MPTPEEAFRVAAQKHLRDTRVMMTIAVDRAAKILLDEMQQLTSLIDHDLEDLKRLDHPYRAKLPPGSPHADWLVHLQTGSLHGGLKRLPASISGYKIEAEIHSESPATWYVLLGTRFMRPRDFVSAAILLREREIQAIFRDAFEARGPGDPVDIHLLEHPEFPAQLPGGV